MSASASPFPAAFSAGATIPSSAAGSGNKNQRSRIPSSSSLYAQPSLLLTRPRTLPRFSGPSSSDDRINIKCTYADSVIVDSFSVPIDVVADVKTEKIIVISGSGFVGSAICKAAVSKGIEVVSLSRLGRPSYTDSWVDQVKLDFRRCILCKMG